MTGGWRAHRRAVAASVLSVALLAPLGWMWWSSLVPDTYSVMDMGVVDSGGGALHRGHEDHAMTDVASLTGPQTREPDVSVTLVARQETVKVEDGPVVDGYTLNGSSPGPEIRATEGHLVEVTFVNESVPDGATLHWHGVDVPNAEDGVAGVTQDAVEEGGEHVYRFVAEDPGTYWYHSHQVSHEQVRGGLFGTVVIEPRNDPAADVVDLVAAVHTYDGRRTVNGRVGESREEVPAGTTVRVRVVNTDNGPMRTWVAGASYTVVAVDGTDLNRPSAVEDTTVLVTAGGRVDLEVTVPQEGGAVRVGAGGGASLVVGPAGATAPGLEEPDEELDLLSYGAPAPLPFDVEAADRFFDYSIGRRPGFVDGRPGLWWSVNGELFPDVPMYVVAQGDVVRMRIENHSGEVHPMHLHGHHAVVLSRDGVEASGSPWWVDSLDVRDGETYEVAFVADNPGIWMDHCHNLEHAAEGLLAHLMYEGVTTSYVVGGEAGNSPE
jgi:FtsP/CotA-like multicopper oxidase with cupredoxin domain